MDPLTLLLIAGGAYLVFRKRPGAVGTMVGNETVSPTANPMDDMQSGMPIAPGFTVPGFSWGPSPPRTPPPVGPIGGPGIPAPTPPPSTAPTVTVAPHPTTAAPPPFGTVSSGRVTYGDGDTSGRRGSGML
jgi:hypothetical protein